MDFFSTRGTPKINLFGANLIQRAEDRNGEYDGNEHSPGQFGVCDEGHRQGNHNAPRGCEALILSKSFRQCGATNQSEGNSNNPGS